MSDEIVFDKRKAVEFQIDKLSDEEIANDVAGHKVAFTVGRIVGRAEAVRWIPVSERLPKEGQEVLVNDRSGSMWVWTLYKGTRVPWQWEDSYGYFQDFDDIIAWQPLPEPYKGE